MPTTQFTANEIRELLRDLDVELQRMDGRHLHDVPDGARVPERAAPQKEER